MTMGEKIYRLRRDKNMTQEELAKLVGVSYQAINKYEKGRVTNIPIQRLELLAYALGTTPEYLRSGLTVSAGDPYDPFLDDVEGEPTPDEVKRRRLCSIINRAPTDMLNAYAAILTLSNDRVNALVRLLDLQGGIK